MQLSDIYLILHWWLITSLVGVIFFPITTKIFTRFSDRGYIFAKIFGVAVLTYLTYLSGILHLLRFSQPSIYFLLAAVITIQALFALSLRNGKLLLRTSFLSLLREKWKIFLFEELLFLAAIFSLSYIRSFAPEIHGLEKFMDYGFINSLLRSSYFPPKDMWLTPESINYYYYGHMATAVLTKLSGIPSQISYNLMLATIFAFCASASFSIAANFVTLAQQTKKFFSAKVLATGLLAVLLASFAGNLHTIYTFFTPYENEKPVPVWELSFSPQTFPNSYWYPNSTRFIYNTIHEFPMYSWVVADLHGHVLDIPFVLFVIAFSMHLFVKLTILPLPSLRQKKNQPLILQLIFLLTKLPLPFTDLLLIGFFLSIMYMTNAWDGAIYLILFAALIGYSYFKLTMKKSEKRFSDSIKRLLNKQFLIYSLGSLIGIFLLFFLFTLPFNSFFKPFVSGVGVLCTPDAFFELLGKTAIENGKTVLQQFQLGPFLFEPNHCQRSPFWQLVILYGFFYFFVLSFLAFLFNKTKKTAVDIFIMLVILVASLLIILPEFIYLKDIYPAHYRANTMFKMVFQSFIMLSLVVSYSITRIIPKLVSTAKTLFQRGVAFLYIALTVILLTLVLIYPYFAINSYYGNLKNYQGLDGFTYFKTSYPTDYDAINWINKNISGQPVILEAQGEANNGASSYTDYARVSANTGLPTVLGWYVHEWLWRGTNEFLGERVSDVQTLYETTDEQTAQQLLKKYTVSYVFVGTLEKEKYLNLSEEKFGRLGNVVYQNGETKIYKID